MSLIEALSAFFAQQGRTTEQATSVALYLPGEGFTNDLDRYMEKSFIANFQSWNVQDFRRYKVEFDNLVYRGYIFQLPVGWHVAVCEIYQIIKM